MKNNFKLLDFFEQRRKALVIKDSFAKATIKEESNSIIIEMECNQNYDVNYIVAANYPEDAIYEFAGCARLFDGKNIISFYDASINVELEIGYDISRTIDIFFEIVDLNFDIRDGIEPTTYKMRIEETSENYAALRELIKFIRKQNKKKGQGENYEHRVDSAKHQRTSRF